MKKRLLCYLLSIACVVSMTACGQQTNAPSTEPMAQNAESSTEPSTEIVPKGPGLFENNCLGYNKRPNKDFLPVRSFLLSV